MLFNFNIKIQIQFQDAEISTRTEQSTLDYLWFLDTLNQTSTIVHQTTNQNSSIEQTHQSLLRLFFKVSCMSETQSIKKSLYVNLKYTPQSV